MRTDGYCPMCNSDKFETTKNMEGRIYYTCNKCKYMGGAVEFIYHKPKRIVNMVVNGYCPKCGHDKFTTERRLNGNSVCHNHKCNYNGKTTEFYKEQPNPTRVLKDLSIKFVVTSTIRKQELKEALELRGVNIPEETEHIINFFDGIFYWLHDGMILYQNSLNGFEAVLAEEVVFPDAIKLINECPVVEKQSTLDEFDIVDGFYHLGNGGKFPWQQHTPLEAAKGYIFSGWFWENPNVVSCGKWSMRRYGITKDGHMSAACSEWDYPVVPKKIRFYKGE